MNFRRVLHILSLLLLVLAAAELVPLVWCLEGGQSRAALGFLCASAVSAILGLIFRLLGHREGDLYRRDGVLIVVGAWILASLTGAIPYWVGDVLPNPVDALFESASGFTTTGATVLRDIEAAGHPMLFWRSFTQWLGGIGIVVLFVALLSELGPGARFLFKLEVPGPKAEVLHDRVQDTAIALGRVYLVLSLAEIGVLLALGLSTFDALTHTFSTVSTGGFSPHPKSIAEFPSLVRLTITFFMAAAGINFAHYYSLAHRRNMVIMRDSEFRTYLWIIFGTTLLVTLSLAGASAGPTLHMLGDALFQVVSILTTTGFSTVDFNQWPDPARTLLVSIMILGGCAGSTAGGFKISRANLRARRIRAKCRRALFSLDRRVGRRDPAALRRRRRYRDRGHRFDRDTLQYRTRPRPGRSHRRLRLLQLVAEDRDGLLDVARSARILRRPRALASTLLDALARSTACRPRSGYPKSRDA